MLLISPCCHCWLAIIALLPRCHRSRLRHYAAPYAISPLCLLLFLLFADITPLLLFSLIRWCHHMILLFYDIDITPLSLRLLFRFSLLLLPPCWCWFSYSVSMPPCCSLPLCFAVCRFFFSAFRWWYCFRYAYGFHFSLPCRRWYFMPPCRPFSLHLATLLITPLSSMPLLLLLLIIFLCCAFFSFRAAAMPRCYAIAAAAAFADTPALFSPDAAFIFCWLFSLSPFSFRCFRFLFCYFHYWYVAAFSFLPPYAIISLLMLPLFLPLFSIIDKIDITAHIIFHAAPRRHLMPPVAAYVTPISPLMMLSPPFSLAIAMLMLFAMPLPATLPWHAASRCWFSPLLMPPRHATTSLSCYWYYVSSRSHNTFFLSLLLMMPLRCRLCCCLLYCHVFRLHLRHVDVYVYTHDVTLCCCCVVDAFAFRFDAFAIQPPYALLLLFLSYCWCRFLFAMLILLSLFFAAFLLSCQIDFFACFSSPYAIDVAFFIIYVSHVIFVMPHVSPLISLIDAMLIMPCFSRAFSLLLFWCCHWLCAPPLFFMPLCDFFAAGFRWLAAALPWLFRCHYAAWCRALLRHYVRRRWFAFRCRFRRYAFRHALLPLCCCFCFSLIAMPAALLPLIAVDADADYALISFWFSSRWCFRWYFHCHAWCRFSFHAPADVISFRWWPMSIFRCRLRYLWYSCYFAVAFFHVASFHFACHASPLVILLILRYCHTAAAAAAAFDIISPRRHYAIFDAFMPDFATAIDHFRRCWLRLPFFFSFFAAFSLSPGYCRHFDAITLLSIFTWAIIFRFSLAAAAADVSPPPPLFRHWLRFTPLFAIRLFDAAIAAASAYAFHFLSMPWCRFSPRCRLMLSSAFRFSYYFSLYAIIFDAAFAAAALIAFRYCFLSLSLSIWCRFFFAFAFRRFSLIFIFFRHCRFDFMHLMPLLLLIFSIALLYATILIFLRHALLFRWLFSRHYWYYAAMLFAAFSLLFCCWYWYCFTPPCCLRWCWYAIFWHFWCRHFSPLIFSFFLDYFGWWFFARCFHFRFSFRFSPLITAAVSLFSLLSSMLFIITLSLMRYFFSLMPTPWYAAAIFSLLAAMITIFSIFAAAFSAFRHCFSPLRHFAFRQVIFFSLMPPWLFTPLLAIAAFAFTATSLNIWYTPAIIAMPLMRLSPPPCWYATPFLSPLHDFAISLIFSMPRLIFIVFSRHVALAAYVFRHIVAFACFRWCCCRCRCCIIAAAAVLILCFRFSFFIIAAAIIAADTPLTPPFSPCHTPPCWCCLILRLRFAMLCFADSLWFLLSFRCRQIAFVTLWFRHCWWFRRTGRCFRHAAIAAFHATLRHADISFAVYAFHIDFRLFFFVIIFAADTPLMTSPLPLPVAAVAVDAVYAARCHVSCFAFSLFRHVAMPYAATTCCYWWSTCHGLTRCFRCHCYYYAFILFRFLFH